MQIEVTFNEVRNALGAVCGRDPDGIGAVLVERSNEDSPTWRTACLYAMPLDPALLDDWSRPFDTPQYDWTTPCCVVGRALDELTLLGRMAHHLADNDGWSTIVENNELLDAGGIIEFTNGEVIRLTSTAARLLVLAQLLNDHPCSLQEIWEQLTSASEEQVEKAYVSEGKVHVGAMA